MPNTLQSESSAFCLLHFIEPSSAIDECPVNQHVKCRRRQGCLAGPLALLGLHRPLDLGLQQVLEHLEHRFFRTLGPLSGLEPLADGGPDP